LMDFNNSPCIKFSEEKEKRTIPGFKKTLRFYEGKHIFNDKEIIKLYVIISC